MPERSSNQGPFLLMSTNIQRECSFSNEKLNELTDEQDMFCFNHASAFYTSNNIVKNVDT